MPVLIAPPAGYEEILAFCGDLRDYARPDGTISPSWEAEKMGFAKLPAPMVLSWDLNTEIKRIKVHKKVVPVFEAVFEAVESAKLWRFLRVFGGAYNFRIIRGGSKVSTHAFGLGSDHDPKRNPLGMAPEECAMASEVVAIMEDSGFTWGGRFRGRKDCMHFQFAKGY